MLHYSKRSSPAILHILCSPQNGKIYSSNEIQLNFTVAPNMGTNFTSFSYSLDGQANQTTNGNTILAGMPPGTHILRIYGNGTYLIGDSVEEFRYPLETVYFSVVFSTSGAILGIIIATAFLMIWLALFIKRRQLAKALKGKKTASFWAGIVIFFLAILFLTPALWLIANEYYFWYWSRDYSTATLKVGGIVLGSVFICTGLYLMRAGTRSTPASENKEVRNAP